MKTTGRRTHELTKIQGDFVVLLRADGVIVYSNQNWKAYCKKYQLPEALWNTKENYLNCLKEMKKFNEVQCIEDVVNGSEEEEIRLSLFYHKEATDYLSVTHRQFSLARNSKGIILYKQLLTDKLPVSSLTTETILETMTDAFFLLDNQMNSFASKSIEKKVQYLL